MTVRVLLRILSYVLSGLVSVSRRANFALASSKPSSISGKKEDGILRLPASWDNCNKHLRATGGTWNCGTLRKAKKTCTQYLRGVGGTYVLRKILISKITVHTDRNKDLLFTFLSDVLITSKARDTAIQS